MNDPESAPFKCIAEERVYLDAVNVGFFSRPSDAAVIICRVSVAGVVHFFCGVQGKVALSGARFKNTVDLVPFDPIKQLFRQRFRRRVEGFLRTITLMTAVFIVPPPFFPSRKVPADSL